MGLKYVPVPLRPTQTYVERPGFEPGPMASNWKLTASVIANECGFIVTCT